MIPEKKSDSIINFLSPKVKKAIAGGMVAASLATGCNVLVEALPPERPIITLTSIPTKDPETNTDPIQATNEVTPTVQNPATPELTLVSPTEVAPSDSIKINMDNIVFPSVGYAKEAYEKDEYNAGVETIKQWVSVWEKMGVFEGVEIENNNLTPVLLDGQARVVCVRTNEKKKLLCPPLDMINGGLKAVPEEGKWDETDKPLSISLRIEELTTGGSGTELVFQLIDMYEKNPTRYIDSKTGLIGKGDYLFPEEIVLPVIVPEKMNGIEEFDLGMEFIDSEGVYKMFIEGLMSNEEANGNYWRDLLRGDVTYDAFMNYLRNSIGGPENKNYWWPMTSPDGVEFKTYGGPYKGVDQIDYSDKNGYGNGVYLDGIYYSFFVIISIKAI